MQSRLLLPLALFWALAVPLLHGHAPAAFAHDLMAGRVTSADLAASDAYEPQTTRERDGSSHSDLPLMVAGASANLPAPAASTNMPHRRPGPIQAPADPANTDARGSPVARHEVTRI